MNKVRAISFWKRDPNSVENIQRLRILPSKKDYVLSLQTKDRNEEKPFSHEEFDQLLSYLFDTLQVDKTPENYKAFQYEDEVQNFALKFFLEIDYSNCTYLAIKGIHPFKQEHYREIMDCFSALLN